jgi:hypothetical protein
MRLYNIQDADRPRLVIAEDIADAIYKWRVVISQENGMEITDVKEPDGINFVAEDHEIISA